MESPPTRGQAREDRVTPRRPVKAEDDGALGQDRERPRRKIQKWLFAKCVTATLTQAQDGRMSPTLQFAFRRSMFNVSYNSH